MYINFAKCQALRIKVYRQILYNLGICAKIPSKYNEGTIPPTYEQELEDGSFIDNLMKTSFKKYKVIHSLASWRVRGQMILLKKSFTVSNSTFILVHIETRTLHFNHIIDNHYQYIII